MSLCDRALDFETVASVRLAELAGEHSAAGTFEADGGEIIALQRQKPANLKSWRRRRDFIGTSSRIAVTGSRVCWTPTSISRDQRRSAGSASASGSFASSARKGRRNACGSSRSPSQTPPFSSSVNRAAAASLSRRPSANGSLIVTSPSKARAIRATEAKAASSASPNARANASRSPASIAVRGVLASLPGLSGLSAPTASPKIEETIRLSMRSSSATISRASGSALR